MGSDKQYNTHCGEMQVFLVLSFSPLPLPPFLFRLILILILPALQTFSSFPCPSLPVNVCMCLTLSLGIPSSLTLLSCNFAATCFLSPKSFSLFSCVTLVHTPLRFFFFHLFPFPKHQTRTHTRTFYSLLINILVLWIVSLLALSSFVCVCENLSVDTGRETSHPNSEAVTRGPTPDLPMPYHLSQHILSFLLPFLSLPLHPFLPTTSFLPLTSPHKFSSHRFLLVGEVKDTRTDVGLHTT